MNAFLDVVVDGYFLKKKILIILLVIRWQVTQQSRPLYAFWFDVWLSSSCLLLAFRDRFNILVSLVVSPNFLCHINLIVIKDQFLIAAIPRCLSPEAIAKRILCVNLSCMYCNMIGNVTLTPKYVSSGREKDFNLRVINSLSACQCFCAEC